MSILQEPVSVDKSNMLQTVVKDGYHTMEEVYKNVPKDQWPKATASNSPGKENGLLLAAVGFFFAAFVLTFRYTNFYRSESRWKIAIETWVMIVFITWALWHTGKLASPLVNAYLLVIITSALALGKLTTMLEMALIAACFVLLGENSSAREMLSLAFVGGLIAQLAPLLLVAYITTMFSADIRFGLNRARLLSETDRIQR